MSSLLVFIIGPAITASIIIWTITANIMIILIVTIAITSTIAATDAITLTTLTNAAPTAATAIRWSASIPEDKVYVKVERGWVTLSGDVDWDYQRSAAERSVQELLGVIGVSNLITIRPRASPIDVKHSIERALVRHAEREAKHLNVLVEGSRVTLRGKVHSLAERQAAQGAAWSAPGVSSVSNELVLD